MDWVWIIVIYLAIEVIKAISHFVSSQINPTLSILLLVNIHGKEEPK